jgi:Cu(I)/Ag(I) efflux system protein CusF
MKISRVVLMSIAVWSTGALGETSQVQPMTTMTNAAATTSASGNHRVIGTVKKVDASAKTVTLDHEPVKSLSWPAMTMTFTVDDPAGMSRLKPGARVEVVVVQRGNDYVVTGVR